MSPHKEEADRLLSGEDISETDTTSVENGINEEASSQPRRRRNLWTLTYAVLGLVSSLMIGFCLGLQAQGMENSNGRSPYRKTHCTRNIPQGLLTERVKVNLEYSQEDILWWNTEYSDPNATDAYTNELWDSTIPWESGIIAMTNEEATAMGLPESQPWPWDSQKKKIYILNTHHLLHCVVR